MTVTGEQPRPSTPQDPSAGRPQRRRDALAVLEVCPYLASDDGAWRSAYAAREHRCHAVRPPAPLAVAKQRQLCLVGAHAGCATFSAAQDVAASTTPVSPGDLGAALWASSAPAPVVLEPARRMGALPAASARGGGQALLIGLMVLAFLVLVIARTQSPAGVAGGTPAVPPGSAAGAASGPGASQPGATGATASPTSDATPSPTATTSPTPTASPTPSATPAPTRTPKPTAAATRTYKVKSGDTLSSIAARFDTTVRKIAALNGISDPRVLRVGQVLQIP